MSRAILTTMPAFDTYPGLLLAVEVAWGADLTVLDGSSWTWSDITDHVILSGGGKDVKEGGTGISIVLGRPDFSTETQTAEMTCQLDNRDMAYSEGGLSANWPNVRRGTPVRVRVSTDGGGSWSVRFQGQTNGFTPQWDPETGRWATVTLSASGPLRKLNQGTGVGVSAMRDGTLADPSVVAYWPCEDQQQANYVAPAVGPNNGVFRVFDPENGGQIEGVPGVMASYSDIPSSGPILTLVDGGDLGLQAAGSVTGSQATVTGFFGGVTGIVPYDGIVLDKRGTIQSGAVMTVFTDQGPAVEAWCITYQINKSTTPYGMGRLRIQGFASAPFSLSDPTVFSNTITFDLLDNTPYEIGLSLSQSGSTTNWVLFVRRLTPPYKASQFVGSVGSNSNGARVNYVSAGSFDDSEGLSVGHVVVRNTVISSTYDSEWAHGWPGETSQARLTRLCATHGIHLETIGAVPLDVDTTSVVDAMGPQFYDTLTVLLRECERTGQGLLYDGLGPGLSYVTKRRRENNASGGHGALVIDASAGQLMEPFAPVDDDQLLINRVDVTRRGGTSYTYSDLSGPEGVEAVGEYATSVDVNTETDDDLVRYAEWLVGIGTQPGYRYPSVSFALETNPALVPDWLDCIPTSRVDITNIATIRRQHSNETIKMLIEGWQETIDAFTWRVTANTSPAAPWNVAVLAAATGTTGDGTGRLQTNGSQLNANYTSGTTISVKTNTGLRWITTSEDADSFPFDISVGGIRATVTGITSTTSPQTFTLSAALPRTFTGSTTTGLGTPVEVWRPPVYGL